MAFWETFIGTFLAPEVSKDVNLVPIPNDYFIIVTEVIIASIKYPLQWRHNELNDVLNHRRLDCLLNRLFRRRTKNTWKLRITGLSEGNPPVTGGFPSQRASNAENVSIWWRHHDQ